VGRGAHVVDTVDRDDDVARGRLARVATPLSRLLVEGRERVGDERLSEGRALEEPPGQPDAEVYQPREAAEPEPARPRPAEDDADAEAYVDTRGGALRRVEPVLVRVVYRVVAAVRIEVEALRVAG
jgi:hypothetical protein